MIKEMGDVKKYQYCKKNSKGLDPKTEATLATPAGQSQKKRYVFLPYILILFI